MLFMVANLAFLVPKNANLALFETSWHFLEEIKVPSSFWHFLAFFGCPLKIYINKSNNNEKPTIFSPSSINVVTKKMFGCKMLL